MGKGLSTAKASIGWMDRAGSGEHRTVAFQHHETGILIRKPAKRGKRNKPVRANQYKPSQSVSNARKTCFAPVRPDAVLNRQVAAFDIDLDAKTKDGYNAV